MQGATIKIEYQNVLKYEYIIIRTVDVRDSEFYIRVTRILQACILSILGKTRALDSILHVRYPRMLTEFSAQASFFVI